MTETTTAYGAKQAEAERRRLIDQEKARLNGHSTSIDVDVDPDTGEILNREQFDQGVQQFADNVQAALSTARPESDGEELEYEDVSAQQDAAMIRELKGVLRRHGYLLKGWTVGENEKIREVSLKSWRTKAYQAGLL